MYSIFKKTAKIAMGCTFSHQKYTACKGTEFAPPKKGKLLCDFSTQVQRFMLKSIIMPSWSIITTLYISSNKNQYAEYFNCNRQHYWHCRLKKIQKIEECFVDIDKFKVVFQFISFQIQC